VPKRIIRELKKKDRKKDDILGFDNEYSNLEHLLKYESKEEKKKQQKFNSSVQLKRDITSDLLNKKTKRGNGNKKFKNK